MKVFVIGDYMTVSACRAGGISDGISCQDAEAARHALDEVLECPDVGVICVLDRYLKEVAPLFSRGVYPVIISIPGPYGPLHGEDAVDIAVRKVAGGNLLGVEQ